MLAAGKGSLLTFINADDPANSYTLKANGSVMRTVPNGDGTSTVTTAGHNVISLYPTDSPAGPSTILYVGQVVYLTDADSNSTILKTTGWTTDICELLT